MSRLSWFSLLDWLGTARNPKLKEKGDSWWLSLIPVRIGWIDVSSSSGNGIKSKDSLQQHKRSTQGWHLENLKDVVPNVVVGQRRVQLLEVRVVDVLKYLGMSALFGKCKEWNECTNSLCLRFIFIHTGSTVNICQHTWLYVDICSLCHIYIYGNIHTNTSSLHMMCRCHFQNLSLHNSVASAKLRRHRH